MIRIRGSVVFMVSFLLAGLVFAEVEQYRWGGPGYDPNLKVKGKISSRYSAYLLRRSNADGLNEPMVSINVDSEETVEHVGQIDLVSSSGVVVSSKKCGRIYHHMEAPWGCYFALSDLETHTGNGKILTFSGSELHAGPGVMLLEDPVDFDELIKYLK